MSSKCELSPFRGHALCRPDSTGFLFTGSRHPATSKIAMGRLKTISAEKKDTVRLEIAMEELKVASAEENGTLDGNLAVSRRLYLWCWAPYYGGSHGTLVSSISVPHWMGNVLQTEFLSAQMACPKTRTGLDTSPGQVLTDGVLQGIQWLCPACYLGSGLHMTAWPCLSRL